MGLKVALLLLMLLLMLMLHREAWGIQRPRAFKACRRHNLRPRAVLTGCGLVAVTVCCIRLVASRESMLQAGVGTWQPSAQPINISQRSAYPACPACPACSACLVCPACAEQTLPASLAHAAPIGVPKCQPADFEGKTELRGEEYHHVKAQAPEECCAICMNATKCVAFTYNSDEKLCRFKTAVQVMTVHPCHVCTSWRKRITSTAQVPTDLPNVIGPTSGDKPSVLQPCAPRSPPAPKQPRNAACRDPAIQPLISEVVAAFESTRAEKRAKGAHPAASEMTGATYGATDVMLIVGWQRAAFLMTALHRLLRADASEEHLYLFQLEYGYSDDVLAVACAWPLPSRIVFTPAHAPGTHGPGYTPGHWNSFTVLEGYRQAEMIAREFCSKLVYMLEEDIFVAPDFFLFHRAAQTHVVKGLQAGERARVFAVTAYNNEHEHSHCDGDLGEEKLRKIHSSVFTRQFYHSLGVSIPVAMLPVVTQHANLQFYNQPAAYNEREFGTLRIYGT
eukprot:COSAG01_NODE_140_length_24259_cov_41.225096_15_plen_506_part_00